MTRHYRKKSFLSQAQHDIRGQVRAAKRRRKIREIIMYGKHEGMVRAFFDIGHTQGEMTAKNIRETTIYGHTQGEMTAKNIRETTIYGCTQGEMTSKNIGYGKHEGMVRAFFDIGHTQGEMTAKNIRETTIYGCTQGEMTSKNIGFGQGEMINKFTPEVQNQPSNSNFDAHYQNYCRCCNYSYCNCKAKNHSYFCSVCKFYKCYKGKGGIYRTKSCMYWRKDSNGKFRIFDVRFHKIKLPWE
ncbi:unnamed protein product [Rhizophagus irregularis]|nr:unnamed protein product [Rhizophagus irregularis]